MMYSFYRAMLSEEFSASVDTIILKVGDGIAFREFLGHKTVLSEQSGYLKSLLERLNGTEVNLPNVHPDVFAALFTYMYTGYLALSTDNIYSVLLGAHVLHMPGAVDICRRYLLQIQQPVSYGNLVKPIPSRKYLSGLYWDCPSTVAPVSPFSPVPPPFESVSLVPSQLHLPTPEKIGLPASPEPNQASTSATRPATPKPSSSASNPPPPSSPTSEFSDDNLGSSSVTSNEAIVSCNNPPTNPNVVKDIACCDGPVRFKRVLNANYNSDLKTPPNPEAPAKRAPAQFVCQYCKHTFKSQYCYKKHTKRHLIPILVNEEKKEKTPPKVIPPTTEKNVQYYPCKTCGSKFPSYYFVHKHRKLCHADESNTPDATRYESSKSN